MNMGSTKAVAARSAATSKLREVLPEVPLLERLPSKPDLLAGQLASGSPFDLGLIPEPELAKVLKLTTRSLRRLQQERIGPKRVVIKRKIFYRRESVLDWLAQQEGPAIETSQPARRKRSLSGQ
jgi:hypothetical protein